MPCSSDEPGAIRKNLSEIPQAQILLREPTLKDFKDSIKNCKATVHHSFLELYNKFLKK